MKLSDKTLTILKNFSTINQSILLREGNVIRTMHQQKTVFASATVEDHFPCEAGIYDLPKFLSIISLYKDCDLRFGEKSCEIVEGKRKATYVYTDPKMIIAPPAKDIKLPAIDLTLDLSWNDLQTVIKAAGIFQLPEIAFVGDGSKVYLRAINSANPTTDDAGVELGETDDTFKLIIKVENIKLLAGDYHVNISSKGAATFEADGVKYTIAVDSKSNYSKG